MKQVEEVLKFLEGLKRPLIIQIIRVGDICKISSIQFQVLSTWYQILSI